MSAINYLTGQLNQALQTLGVLQPLEIHLEHPSAFTHGDYATNLAMRSFPVLKAAGHEAVSEFKNPREWAEKLVETLEKQIEGTAGSEKVISKIEIAGPGFINFSLELEWLLGRAARAAQSQFDLQDAAAGSHPVVVEYSSPNIAKPFTIGHLRSTIIGDAIANLWEARGWEVFRDNHLGDWGTQFGKQIYAIKTWGDEAKLERSEHPVKDLVELYVKFHQEAELDPSLEDAARAWFKKLEEGDSEARRLWQNCIDWSWKEFSRIYSRLNIHFTENGGRGYGESFFEDKMAPAIEELKAKNLLTESQGAWLIFYPDEKLPPLMVLKKDGASLYATRDFATDKFRLEHYGKEVLIINEIGAEQSLYMKQIYEAEAMLGWYKPGQRVHVGHGHYRFEDKKMSTRKGNVIWLDDVLLEAFTRVKNRSQKPLSDELVWDIAIGALKWNDLRREASKDVVFDFDEILNLQGNSGPYVQYSYVRCASILKKLENSSIEIAFDTLLNNKVDISDLKLETETDLLRTIYSYSEVVAKAAKEYAPHHLSLYLFELAQRFNAFYGQAPILDESNKDLQAVRITITKSVANVLEHGLRLLGISVVEEM